MSGRYLIIAAVALSFGACWMQAAAVYSDDDRPEQQAVKIVLQEPIPASVALFN